MESSFRNCFFVSSLFLVSCGGQTHDTPDAEPVASATCLCETQTQACQAVSFLDLPHLEAYAPYGSEYVTTQYGYGVYQEDVSSAEVVVSQSETPTAVDGTVPDGQVLDPGILSASFLLHMKITAPMGESSYFNPGTVDGWASVRREFTSPVCLCGCSGISLEMRYSGPINIYPASLRLVLADVMNEQPLVSAAGHTEDEPWWQDLDKCNHESAWKQYQIPFDSLAKATGAGTRSNDWVFERGCIIAFEIGIYFEGQALCIDRACPDGDKTGNFSIRNVGTY